ncbi:MAG: MarR family transcriptional regulator [Gammaproteobacteria bacterium]|nr:MarR family transcriptional regulator [Gammaproteobacteria bacterium]
MNKPVSKAQQTSDSQQVDSLGFLVHEVARSFTNAYATLMSPLGLTRPQARVIAYLRRFPGITQIELCEYIGVGRMAMSGLIDRMESKGLVKRVDDPADGRVKRIFHTREARKMRPDIDHAIATLTTRSIADISARDLRTVMRALRSINDNLLELVEESRSEV